MPVYEYECGHCRFRFEMRQGFDAEPAAACPRCQGSARRVFHPLPLLFKGSGFYITDSRKGKMTDSEKGKEEAAGKQEYNEGTASASQRSCS